MGKRPSTVCVLASVAVTCMPRVCSEADSALTSPGPRISSRTLVPTVWMLGEWAEVNVPLPLNCWKSW